MIFKPNGNYIVYSVQSGDSLWILSQTFGTSIETLKSFNNLTNDTLYVGQKLIVKKVSLNPVQINGTIKWWTYVKSATIFIFAEPILSYSRANCKCYWKTIRFL